jgi:hypothetical protein
VNPCKKRQTKFRRLRSPNRTTASESILLASTSRLPGYPAHNPHHNSSYLSIAPNVNPVAVDISTMENLAIHSTFVYPPAMPITQNLPLSLPSGATENTRLNRMIKILFSNLTIPF